MSGWSVNEMPNMSNTSRSNASVPGMELEQRRERRVVGGHLDPDAQPAAGGDVEEVDDDLEALGDDAVGQLPARVSEVVHGGQVDAHRVAVIGDRLRRVEVTVPAGVEDGLAEALLDEAAVPLRRRSVALGAVVSGVGGNVGHQRFPSRTGVGVPDDGISCTCTLAPAPVCSRRRSSWPSSISWWSVSMAWSRVSGVGGQPGA